MASDAARLLVCFAVREEADPFHRILKKLGSSAPTILVTGMGQANAAAALQTQLASSTPRLVLTCGFAGGLNPVLTPCSVVFSADAGLGFEPTLGALGCLPAKFHCARRVAISAQEKLQLREATGADAVEMESGIIRDLCRERQIPSATIRVISDAANEDLPLDFNALMTPDCRISFARLAAKLVCSPFRIPALLRLQKRTRQAAGRLAEVLVNLARRDAV
jgi:adenosylhomocysteine nucleosidase